MKWKCKRFASLLLCAALTACLLAGCEDAAGGGASDSAASETIPESQTEASAEGLLPGELEENTFSAFTDPAEAFETSLGWGPGTAGTSLKSVIAAADMLHWAEENELSRQSASVVKKLVQNWYDGLSDTRQEGFAEAWPLIKDNAEALLTKKSSMIDRIADAGLDADDLPGCSQKNWTVLQTALDDIVPEVELQ